MVRSQIAAVACAVRTISVLTHKLSVVRTAHATLAIQQTLRATINALDAGDRDKLSFRPFEKPKDFVFEKAVERLGLLGPKLVEDTVYVYGNLNGFRMSFGLICAHFTEMSDRELRARSVACLRTRGPPEHPSGCVT